MKHKKIIIIVVILSFLTGGAYFGLKTNDDMDCKDKCEWIQNDARLFHAEYLWEDNKCWCRFYDCETDSIDDNGEFIDNCDITTVRVV